MDDMYLIKKPTLVALANAIRGILNTTDTYTLQEMINILNNDGNNTPPIVDGSTLS